MRTLTPDVQERLKALALRESLRFRDNSRPLPKWWGSK